MEWTKEPELLEERRKKAISLLETGMSQSKIAMLVNVSRQSVSRWVKAFRAEGIDGLNRKPKSGRPPKMTDAQKRELIWYLGTITSHSKGRPMSSTAIADLIRDQFGIEFHKHHIPKLLRSLKNKESCSEDSKDPTDDLSFIFASGLPTSDPLSS
jgi:transposase